MPSPAFDDNPHLFEGIEDLTIEQLVAEPRIEALAVAAFPWAPRLDIGGLRADRRDPIPRRPWR